ncbi:MAG: hypothetical protein ACOCWQ_05255, partial [Nanoarchaeota archaeon]
MDYQSRIASFYQLLCQTTDPMHSEGVIEHRFSADGVDVHAQVARMEGAVPMITLRMPRLPKYGMRNMPVSERKVYRFNTEGDAMMQTESYSGGGMEIVA